MKDTADIRAALFVMFEDIGNGNLDKDRAKLKVAVIRTVIDTAKLDLAAAKLTNAKAIQPMVFAGTAIEHESQARVTAKAARRLRAA